MGWRVMILEVNRMQIVNIPIDKLKQYNKQLRHNDKSVAAVAESIAKFGFLVPILIDDNNVIIAGEVRYKAAIKSGMKNVPCIIITDLSEEQVKAFRIVDNKTVELSEWNIEELQKELESICDIDLSFLEFDFLELKLEVQIASEDDFDIEENLSDKPKARLGEIYQLGRHLLMCGDCTDKEQVNMLMGGKLADLYLTDPPYNVDYSGGTEKAMKILNDKMEQNEFVDFLNKAFCAADQIMRPGAAFYIWFASNRADSFISACEQSGWQIRQQLIWVKNHFVIGRQDYQWKHEPCIYGWKDGAPHNWYSDRSQTTVLEFDKPLANLDHPTMKPIKLFDYLIQNSTKVEDIVADFFAGSGTTLIACEQNGRTSYNMELEPCYVDVIIKRWESMTGKEAIRIK